MGLMSFWNLCLEAKPPDGAARFEGPTACSGFSNPERCLNSRGTGWAEYRIACLSTNAITARLNRTMLVRKVRSVEALSSRKHIKKAFPFLGLVSPRLSFPLLTKNTQTRRLAKVYQNYGIYRLTRVGELRWASAARLVASAQRAAAA